MIIVRRSEWGARAPKWRNSMPLPKGEVWDHHTGDQVTQNDDASWAKAYCRGIQNYHMDIKGWSDIAYSFLIDPKGRVYVGRGWGIEGGHTKFRNDDSHGICFMGNFEVQKPTRAALNAFRSLVAAGKRVGAITKSPKIDGHRNAPGASTACPGKHLMAQQEYLRGEDDMATLSDTDQKQLKNLLEGLKKQMPEAGVGAIGRRVGAVTRRVERGEFADADHGPHGGTGESHDHIECADFDGHDHSTAEPVTVR